MRSRARLSRWPDIAHAALIEHSWLELTLRLAEGRDAIDCDALYGFDIAGGALRPSVVRATGYSCGLGKEAPPEQWRHQSDIGLLYFRFLLAPGISLALCAAFGAGETGGRLPVDIPALDEQYRPAGRILWPRGHSAQKPE